MVDRYCLDLREIKVDHSRGFGGPVPKERGTQNLVRVLAFLRTANLLGFLAPDVPGNGNPNLTTLDHRALSV